MRLLRGMTLIILFALAAAACTAADLEDVPPTEAPDAELDSPQNSISLTVDGAVEASFDTIENLNYTLASDETNDTAYQFAEIDLNGGDAQLLLSLPPFIDPGTYTLLGIGAGDPLQDAALAMTIDGVNYENDVDGTLVLAAVAENPGEFTSGTLNFTATDADNPGSSITVSGDFTIQIDAAGFATDE